MMPVNGYCPPVLTDNQFVVDQPPIMSVWQCWADEAAAGEGRQEALTRLTDCLTLGGRALYLNSLNLSELPNCLPSSLQKLDITGNQLTRLPEPLPPTLKVLEASDNRLRKLPALLPDDLEILEVSSNDLTHLPPVLPTSLQQLLVNNNRLKQLPHLLPPHLKVLESEGNRLHQLPEQCSLCLEVLSVSNNRLSALPAVLPDSLRLLECDDNRLEYLPRYLPASLHVLTLTNNRLTDLPARLPPQLEELDVTGNGLEQLPDTLPVNLKELGASHNRLTHLPTQLPIYLEVLQVDYNQLTELPRQLPERLHELTVMANRLSTLPALPPSLKKLNISDNCFKHLPAHRLRSLPLSVLYADNNQLEELPAQLPLSLKELSINSNQLKELPEQLPQALEVLFTANNELTDLPLHLPDSLSVLNINNNLITALPANLPDTLTDLYCRKNRLQALPATLPPTIKRLYVSENQLHYLPEQLPSSLRIMHVDSNQLTCLPTVLPRRLKELHIHHNPIVRLPSQLPVTLTCVYADDALYSDLRRVWMHANHYAESFIDKIAHWSPNTRPWQTIVVEFGCNQFGTFLQQLYSGQNADNVSLKHRVGQWLDYLANVENRTLREKTFLLADVEVRHGSVDLVSYYFNRMYMMMIEDQLMKMSASVRTLFDNNRRLFRLQLLGDIAAHHVMLIRQAAPHFNEDIEIYLAYQTKLRDELSLPIDPPLQLSEIARTRVTDNDIALAKAAVHQRELNDFIRYLVSESMSWAAKLIQWDPVKVQAANNDYLDQIASVPFQQQIDNLLAARGAARTNEEEREMIGKRCADDLLYYQRYQLSYACLAAHQALDLLMPFNQPPALLTE